jgi:hypothetical protein
MLHKKLFRDAEHTDMFFEIEDDPTHQLLRCKWIGYTDIGQVRTGSAVILDAVCRSRRHLLLVDSRREEGPWNDSNRWIVESWLPQVTAEGLQKTAILASANIFSAMSAREHMETARENGFDVRTFDTEAAALKWLTGKKELPKK